MKRRILYFLLMIILLISLLFVTGCGQKNEEQNQENIQNTVVEEIVEEPESPIKNGKYDVIIVYEDETLPDENTYLEIYDSEITLVDEFAQITQKGTFEIKDNKLVGTYNEVEYFDHSTGDYTKKDISDELEFEILDNDTLKDNLGFGKSFDNILNQGYSYKLSQEYGDSSDWKEMYLSFIKNDLKQSDSATEGDMLLEPFIGLIDLNFDNVPELLYYDAEDFINAGDMYTNVYTIENGKVTYKTKISIRRDEKFCKLPDNKVIIHYDGDGEPDYSHLKIIEDLQGKTISTYNGTHSIWLEDKANGNSQTMTEAEYNQILVEYFDNSDAEPEVLKTYALIEDYSDDQKTEIFETAVEEYENSQV